MVAELGEPVTTAKRKDLPFRVGYWPTEVPLKDRQGREDRYVSRRLIRDDPRSSGALCYDLYRYGAGELLMFPYAVMDHWLPRRRVLALYYDRRDLLQGYYLDPPERDTNLTHDEHRPATPRRTKRGWQPSGRFSIAR